MDPEDASARARLSLPLTVGPDGGQLAWGPPSSASRCVLAPGLLGSSALGPLGLLGAGAARPASELAFAQMTAVCPGSAPSLHAPDTGGLVAAVGREEVFCLRY